MTKINTILLTLALVLTATFGYGQRFLSEVFTDVEVTTDVTYGVNATLLFIAQEGEAIPQELKMDVYEPAGDMMEQRPLVLVFHTGNFLPSVTNAQIPGTKTDSSVVEICNRLARRGYVAASVDYRLGWNPLAETQPERTLGLIQAAYRGVQDGRNCVRYFRNSVAVESNPFRISEDRITAFGVGTGGYLVLGMAYLSDYNEIVTTTGGPGKFLLSVEPLIPMVVPAYHGDINGTELAIAPDGAFGYPPGDTSNYVNFPEYSSDIQLMANVGGALGDRSWINEGEVPSITVQAADDPFAPYVDGTLIVPTTGNPIVRVQGGRIVAEINNGNGNNQIFIDANIDDVYTSTAMTNSDNAGHDYFEGLYPFTRPLNGNGLEEGVVIDWWDPNSPAPGAGMGIPWNMLPHPLGGTFHTQGLMRNMGMSAEKARTNIDTIMGYFYPRAYVALDLETLVNTDDIIQPQQVRMTLAPNPVGAELLLTSSEETPMQAVRLYDMNGRLLRHYNNVNTNTFFITRGDIAPGTYVISVEFEEGLASTKVIFK